MAAKRIIYLETNRYNPKKTEEDNNHESKSYVRRHKYSIFVTFVIFCRFFFLRFLRLFAAIPIRSRASRAIVQIVEHP
jgi:hypothetical protein